MIECKLSIQKSEDGSIVRALVDDKIVGAWSLSEWSKALVDVGTFPNPKVVDLKVVS